MGRAAVWSLLLLVGCRSILASRNEPLPVETAPVHGRATFDVRDRRGVPDVMVILALSGGGSRSAYFSGSTMLALDRVGLLDEVDAITAVSGGALAGAYYCITEDPGMLPEVHLRGGLDLPMPIDVAGTVAFDTTSGRLVAREPLSPQDADRLAARCRDEVRIRSPG